MRADPLVSILIPLFNKREHVERTVESALNQTHEQLEVLVIDDGSTDGSLDALSGITDPRLKVVSRTNLGANATRNELIEWSSGEFVQLLDADDLIDPRKIQVQVEAFEAGVDAVLCHLREVSRTGSDRIHEGIDPTDLVTGLAGAGVGVLVPLHRRQSLIDCGGFDVELPASQEYELHLRLALKGHWRNVVVVQQCLATWQRVDHSIASDEARVYEAKASVLRKLLPLAKGQQDRDALALALMNAGRHLARVGSPRAPAVFQDAIAASAAAADALPQRHAALVRFPAALARWERLEGIFRRS